MAVPEPRTNKQPLHGKRLGRKEGTVVNLYCTKVMQEGREEGQNTRRNFFDKERGREKDKEGTDWKIRRKIRR